MTIDERLEKLAERHAALAQTVELIAGMQQANEQRVETLVSAVTALTRIMESHERRLADLEDGE